MFKDLLKYHFDIKKWPDHNYDYNQYFYDKFKKEIWELTEISFQHKFLQFDICHRLTDRSSLFSFSVDRDFVSWDISLSGNYTSVHITIDLYFIDELKAFFYWLKWKISSKLKNVMDSKIKD